MLVPSLHGLRKPNQVSTIQAWPTEPSPLWPGPSKSTHTAGSMYSHGPTATSDPGPICGPQNALQFAASRSSSGDLYPVTKPSTLPAAFLSTSSSTWH
ncbi:hypothetical protein Tco_0782935 [Tanacetum coccineum]